MSGVIPEVSPCSGGLSALRHEAGVMMFGDTRFRPSPHSIAALISQGLSEADIVAAATIYGFQSPQMGKLYEELDVDLPYFQQISDTVAESQDTTVLFAGRDAETLHDDFAITHPNIPNYVLPASADLWRSDGMKSDALAAPFFNSFGLTRSGVLKPQSKFELIDTGFYGSIGEQVDERLNALYQTSLLALGVLSVRLVCASSTSLGKQITDFPEDARVRELSRYSGLHGLQPYLPYWSHGNAYPIAVGLQLLPHYHGAYIDLQQSGEAVVAVPNENEKIAPGITDKISPNESIVNPVAAALVQYKVVRAALIRSGSF